MQTALRILPHLQAGIQTKSVGAICINIPHIFIKAFPHLVHITGGETFFSLFQIFHGFLQKLSLPTPFFVGFFQSFTFLTIIFNLFNLRCQKLHIPAVRFPRTDSLCLFTLQFFHGCHDLFFRDLCTVCQRLFLCF